MTTMPTREEKEPPQIAAGTLPRAIEVKAIDDWMVDGTRREEEQALVERVGQEHRDEAARGQAEQREDHERAGQDGDVEPPVLQPVQRLAGGEPGAVEEEQNSDGNLRGPRERGQGRAVRGDQAGDPDGDQDAENERIESSEQRDLRQHGSTVRNARIFRKTIVAFTVMPNRDNNG